MIVFFNTLSIKRQKAGVKINHLPWGLFEYFHAKAAVDTAPTMPPTARNFTASRAFFSCKLKNHFTDIIINHARSSYSENNINLYYH